MAVISENFWYNTGTLLPDPLCMNFQSDRHLSNPFASYPVKPNSTGESPASVPSREENEEVFRNVDNRLIELFKSGKSEEALSNARLEFEGLLVKHGPQHQFPLYSLSNLMHLCVRAQMAEHVRPDEVKLLAERTLTPSEDCGFFRLHALSRLVEYTAYFGHTNLNLRETARQSIKALHHLYPLSSATDDLRKFSAIVLVTAAANIAHWLKSHQPLDYRDIDYIAKCGRDTIAFFNPCEGDFYFGLYHLRRNREEEGRECFEQVLNDQSTSPELLTASKEALLQCYIRANNRGKSLELYGDLIKRVEQFAEQDPLKYSKLSLRLKQYKSKIDNLPNEEPD